jgi:potassium/hydrogen antiporter
MDELGLGMHSQRESEMRSFAATTADVVVMFVFLVLGANLPFGELPDEGLPALLTVAAFVLVARPLTVLACLVPDRRGRWERRELAFVAWTRETGVVPAALVGVLVAQGVRQESELITVVALAVVVTLLLQATTKAWLARRLGLEEPRSEEPHRRASDPA